MVFERVAWVETRGVAAGLQTVRRPARGSGGQWAVNPGALRLMGRPYRIGLPKLALVTELSSRGCQ